jgi:hypothetical protein
LAPWLASSRANATPMPALAPVTSAHLPLKSCVFAIADHHIGLKWESDAAAIGRIISARITTSFEQRAYEDGSF